MNRGVVWSHKHQQVDDMLCMQKNPVPSESHNNEHQSCRIVDDPNLKNVDNKAQEFTDVMKVRDVRSKTSAAT
jgi:hypothetical protein